jgi:hypothetical protein
MTASSQDPPEMSGGGYPRGGFAFGGFQPPSSQLPPWWSPHFSRHLPLSLQSTLPVSQTLLDSHLHRYYPHYEPYTKTWYHADALGKNVPNCERYSIQDVMTHMGGGSDGSTFEMKTFMRCLEDMAKSNRLIQVSQVDECGRVTEWKVLESLPRNINHTPINPSVMLVPQKREQQVESRGITTTTTTTENNTLCIIS